MEQNAISPLSFTKLFANAFTRTGYTYEGWNTKADGSGTPYTDKQEVKNLTAKRDAVVTMYARRMARIEQDNCQKT